MEEEIRAQNMEQMEWKLNDIIEHMNWTRKQMTRLWEKLRKGIWYKESSR